MRLDADGSRDPSFVAGSVDVEHALVRLQPGGSLYTTFSGDGRQTFGFPGAAGGAASALALAADGGLVTAGSALSTTRTSRSRASRATGRT